MTLKPRSGRTQAFLARALAEGLPTLPGYIFELNELLSHPDDPPRSLT
jgi:hypothetical protein